MGYLLEQIGKLDVVGLNLGILLGNIVTQELHILLQHIKVSLEELAGEGVVRGAGLLCGSAGPAGCQAVEGGLALGQQVLQLLGSGVKFCKTAPDQKGQYKRAYVIMKDTKKC